MMHKLELYLNDDEYKRLTVLQMYLTARSKELFSESDLLDYPLDFILKFGVFDGVFDLSCLKDQLRIEEMEDYLRFLKEGVKCDGLA